MMSTNMRLTRSGNQLFASDQHSAAGGVVQQEGEGSSARVQQNKPVKVSNKPVIVLS